MVLPSAKQQWAHATNTVDKLTAAVMDPKITAIEADISMGYEKYPIDEGPPQFEKVPLATHAPEDESDLPMYRFLEIVTQTPSSPTGPSIRFLRKHIKLDFKTIDSLAPTLQLIRDLNVVSSCDTTNDGEGIKHIFLNADILPGPGKRSEEGEEETHIPADKFLETCIRDAQKTQTPSETFPCFSFSLGYRVKFETASGYTREDINKMMDLVTRYDLLSFSAGVVLALNARLLSRDPSVFDAFLGKFPSAQILAWTGFGEPPIPKAAITAIKQHFQMQGSLAQIGFDCVLQA